MIRAVACVCLLAAGCHQPQTSPEVIEQLQELREKTAAMERSLESLREVAKLGRSVQKLAQSDEEISELLQGITEKLSAHEKALLTANDIFNEHTERLKHIDAALAETIIQANLLQTYLEQ